MNMGNMRMTDRLAVQCDCAVGTNLKEVLIQASVANPDPGSGAFLTPVSGIGFFRIPDPIFLRA